MYPPITHYTNLIHLLYYKVMGKIRYFLNLTDYKTVPPNEYPENVLVSESQNNP